MKFSQNIYLLSIILLMTFFVIGCKSTTIRDNNNAKSISSEHGLNLKHSPIEDDPRYKSIFNKIDKKVDETLKYHPARDRKGYIHVFWNTKKKILKEEYGIDWQSPVEMNPRIMFD